MPDIHLDLRARTPIYAQIVEQIQSLLLSGDLQPGDQLPTLRELAEQLGVNFNTVARAYRILDEGGLISTQHGRGTYILDLSTADEHRLDHGDALDRLTRRYLALGLRLGYEAEEIQQRLEEHVRTTETGTQP